MRGNQPADGCLKDRENRVIPLTEDFKKFLMGFLGKRLVCFPTYQSG